MVITPMDRGFGATVRAIDLRQPLTDRQQVDLLAAADEHVLLSFPGQAIDDGQQLGFAANFGTPTSYFKRKAALVPGGDPRIISLTNEDADGSLKRASELADEGIVASRLWHSDNSWRQVPDRFTLLAGKEVPPTGGNTEFIDMRAAWDALPDSRKAALRDLVVAHSREQGRAAVGVKLTDEERQLFPPVPQPLVRTNPRTGRQALYLGMFASHVLGMAEEPGRQLVQQLLAYIGQPRFVHSYAWQVDDLIIWDNAQTSHRSTPFAEHEYRRVMRRIGVLEQAPLIER